MLSHPFSVNEMLYLWGVARSKHNTQALFLCATELFPPCTYIFAFSGKIVIYRKKHNNFHDKKGISFFFSNIKLNVEWLHKLVMDHVPKKPFY